MAELEPELDSSAPLLTRKGLFNFDGEGEASTTTVDRSVSDIWNVSVVCFYWNYWMYYQLAHRYLDLHV